MELDYMFCMLLGFLCGMVACYICCYIREHKSELNYNITTLKEDVINLHVKFDNLIKSIKP